MADMAGKRQRWVMHRCARRKQPQSNVIEEPMLAPKRPPQEAAFRVSATRQEWRMVTILNGLFQVVDRMVDAEFGFAKISDLSELLALYATLRPADAAYPPGEAKVALQRLLDQDSIRLIVARIDGHAVATCMLATIANFASLGRPIGYLEHVVTAEQQRGKGIGRGMLTYALDVAWEIGCCKVVLLSGAQRVSAHRTYEAVGFKGDRERGYVIKSPV